MSRSSSIAACYENHSNWKMIVSCTRDIILYYLLFFLTVYATYQSVPLKISRIAPPTRFTSSPYIEDFSNGQLLTTQNKVAFSEVSFVLYYAPWCAESKTARKIYENIANIYGNRVFFSSINCWQPGGECRVQYSNVPNWPTIMSYRSTGFGLQFNGPLSEKSLLNFVDSLMYPMKRITTLDDLLVMMNTHNIVVLAILNMKRDQGHFKAFYQASLKYLETDPYREIGFAICTGDSSKMLGAKDQPKIRIYLWNETLEYSQSLWQVTNILKYIKNSIHHLQRWLSPNGKSNAIASQFTRSSLMLVFTPRTYSMPSFSYYNMIRQIGHIYHNCINDSWVKELTGQHFTKFHENDLQKFLKLQENCKSISNHSTPFNIINQADEFAFTRDDRIPKSLVIQNLFYKCKALDFDPSFTFNYTIENYSKLEELSGLSCVTNKSSTTVVLDSLTYGIFARQLGIEINEKPFKTAVAILDDEDEKVFVMNKTVTLDNMVEFLKKYSYGYLTNFKRSIEAIPTPFTISKNLGDSSKISIAEVSSDLLNQRILQTNKTTVLFIYSAQCNFCNLMSHYLLSISSTLRSLANVEFIRVDGDKNDFNVNYGQEGFPLLIIYPQNRKTEKVIFPSKLKVNKQNIISFILSNLPKASKIEGIAQFCRNLTRKSYVNRCSNVLRSEVSDAIERSLQTWRNDVTSRAQVYKAIVTLRTLYLQLINVNPEDYDDIEIKIKKISALWNKARIF